MCFLRPTAHIPEYYLKLRHIERQDFKLSQHTGSTRQIKSHTETLPQIKPHAGTVPLINLNTWTPLQIKSHIRAVKGKVIPLQAVVSQRVSRGIAPLFHDRGTRRRWVVSSTPRPHFTPEKDPVPILQDVGWASGPVCTGGKSRLHRDSIPDRPAHSQSLNRLSYPAHSSALSDHKYIWWGVQNMSNPVQVSK